MSFSLAEVRILVRGGGDLASGVILRLVHAGFRVLLTELPQPLTVRRTVSFSQAVYDGQIRVEDVVAHRINALAEAQAAWQAGELPVLIDAQADARLDFNPHVLVDARMRKKPPELGRDCAPLVVGLGPGFDAGSNCDAVVETNRGPFLGRVIWSGPAEADTGVPESVNGMRAERVLRAPCDGALHAVAVIGDRLAPGALVAEVAGRPVASPFAGVLRGLVQDGLRVNSGEKIGDVDPRNDPRLCWLVSDKALAVGGGVLEAILGSPTFRSGRLFESQQL